MAASMRLEEIAAGTVALLMTPDACSAMPRLASAEITARSVGPPMRIS